MTENRSPTIVDVAAAAGVSTAAVSKVLRNAYGVSDQMRDAVGKAIADLNYRPRVGARSMRGATYTLGLVVPGGFSPFFSDIYGGISEALNGTSYRSIIAIDMEVTEDRAAAIDDLLDRQVDGLILVAPSVPRSWIERAASRVPVVVVARHDHSTVYDAVFGDDRLGASLVMQHLFDLGHRDIVHIANHETAAPDPENPHGDRLRRLVYEQMMIDAGHADRIRVLESLFDEHAAHLAVRRLLATEPLPTAIFAGADEAAFGALRAISESPDHLADSIAVVGYDNTRFADHPRISLTSVDQSGHELGRRAAALVLDRVAGSDTAVQQLIEPRLIVRGSSIPAAAVAHDAGEDR